MSVGITGTLEARWAQLEEAYRAVVRPDAAPVFRAAQVCKTVNLRLVTYMLENQILLSSCCCLFVSS